MTQSDAAHKNYINQVLCFFNHPERIDCHFSIDEVSNSMPTTFEHAKVLQACRLLIVQNVLKKNSQQRLGLFMPVSACSCGHDAVLSRNRHPNCGFTITCSDSGCRATVKRQHANDAIEYWNSISCRLRASA